MRNLPGKVQEFLQLHQNATTVQQLFLGVQDFYIRTRVQGDMGSIHVTQPVGKPDVKDKTCFKKCSHCGKKGHVAKDCWEKHPDKKPTPKPRAKAQPTKPGEKGKGRGKVEERRKEEERETSFEELMGKRNKMTKSIMKRKTRVRTTQNQKLIQVLEDLSSRFMSKSPCA